MPKKKAVAKRKNDIAATLLLRDLRLQLKSARAAITRAEKISIEFERFKADVEERIGPVLTKQDEFEKTLAQAKDDFADRVIKNAETMAANFIENRADNGRFETSSGTRKSALGRLSDEGALTKPLPGGFESGKK